MVDISGPPALGDVALSSLTLTGAGPSTKKLYLSGNNFLTLLNSDGSASDMSVDSGGTVTANGRFVAFGNAANSVTVAGAATGGNVLLGVTAGSTGPNLGAVIGNILGTGALMAQVPDSATPGGNARGANAVDWQSVRTAATQVASGASATVIGGTGNTASGSASTAGGSLSTASAQWGVALGRGATANGVASLATGQSSNAHSLYGARVHSSGNIATAGDAQLGDYVLLGRSTAGAAIRLSADGAAAGAANVANTPNNTAWTGTMVVTARDQTTGGSYHWSYPAVRMNRGANAASLTISTGTADFASSGTQTGTPLTTALAVSADTTNGGLNLTFTPVATNTNTWDVCAVLRTSEAQ